MTYPSDVPDCERANAVERVDSCVFEPLLDSHEAASLLCIQVKTLQRLARRREIPSFVLGGKWRFRASDLEVWVRSRVHSARHPCRLDSEESDGT
jgi:excisionase family DNA binding protein